MWITIFDCNTHQAITNATFNVPTYNKGGGLYHMTIGAGQNFCFSAPGYGTVCSNTDSHGEMWGTLCPAPLPTTYGECWS